MKISIIDIGSNTIKLVIYDVKKDNSFISVHQESSKVRLGDSLASSDSLTEQSILKSIDVLLLYRDIARLHSSNKVICVGTSAVREAKNGKYFIDQVFKKDRIKSKGAKWTGRSLLFLPGSFHIHVHSKWVVL